MRSKEDSIKSLYDSLKSAGDVCPVSAMGGICFYRFLKYFNQRLFFLENVPDKLSLRSLLLNYSSSHH